MPFRTFVPTATCTLTPRNLDFFLLGYLGLSPMCVVHSYLFFLTSRVTGAHSTHLLADFPATPSAYPPLPPTPLHLLRTTAEVLETRLLGNVTHLR